ncbi:MAG: hypothetical protein KGO53_13190 [Alphaproteobacteria bacterium]|nr:hypothetical protein [Alphaproteobacteria bacterium]
MKTILVLGLALMMALTSPARADSSSSSLGVSVTILPKGAAKVPLIPLDYTPVAAAISVQHAGFRHIRLFQRRRNVYWFLAEKHEVDYRIAVTVRAGRVSKIVPYEIQ